MGEAKMADELSKLRGAVEGATFQDPMVENLCKLGLGLTEMLEKMAKERRDLEFQIDRLAEFIMDEVPGEPSENEGAVDCATRIMRHTRIALGEHLHPGESVAVAIRELIRKGEELCGGYGNALMRLHECRKVIAKTSPESVQLLADIDLIVGAEPPSPDGLRRPGEKKCPS